MTKFVKITKKILKYHPDWESIVDKSGVVLSQTSKSVYVHITSKGRAGLNIKYTIPIDCVEFISGKDTFERAL